MTEQAIFLAFAQTHSNGTVIKASFSLWTQTTLKEKGMGDFSFVLFLQHLSAFL